MLYYYCSDIHREKEDDSFRKGEKDQSKLYWPCLFFKYRGISVSSYMIIYWFKLKKSKSDDLYNGKGLALISLLPYACVHVLVMSTLLGVLYFTFSLLDTKQQIDKGSS